MAPPPPPLLVLGLALAAATLLVQARTCAKQNLLSCLRDCRLSNADYRITNECNRCYPGICPPKGSSSIPGFKTTLIVQKQRQDSAVRHFPGAARQSASSKKILADGSCLHGNTYHPLYSTWFDMNHCNLHVCKENGTQTISLSGSCMKPPSDLVNCTRYRPAGQCCYNYNCPTSTDPSSDSCTDDSGQVRPAGSSWVDDPRHPCRRYLCRNGQPVLLSDARPLCPPPPSHECRSYQPEGECCNDFDCPVVQDPLGCVDENGVRREHSAVWYDSDLHPCLKFLCVNGSTQLLVDKNSGCGPPPAPGCHSSPVPGQCCPAYANCSCEYAGAVYVHGALFPDNSTHPCRRLLCDNGTVITVKHTACEPLACDHTVWPIGQCCRQCVGCLHHGAYRPEGSTWPDDPDRPCVLYTCVNGQMTEVNRTSCPPAPDAYCKPFRPPGVCCELWDCEKAPCVYGGVTRDHGATWPRDPIKPCVVFTCNNSAVQVADLTPSCPPPPAPHCQARYLPFQCCSTYDCNTTCSYKSVTYNLGDVWVDDPTYPCKWYTCEKTGVQLVNSTACSLLSPPGCVSVRPVGQCCRVCVPSDTSNCEDANGNPRSDGELYYDDTAGCILVRCVNGEEDLVANRSALCAPANDSCTVVGVQNCCPIYHCGLSDTSNCEDANGNPRSDGELYYDDTAGCILVHCVNGEEDLVANRSALCAPANDSCTVVGIQNCCPIYDCGSSDVPTCTDSAGQPRAEGDMYYNDPEHCVMVECRAGQEVVLLDKTTLCLPPPNNTACIVEGIVDCCPVYSCPDCTYNNNTYPIGTQWWDDPRRQCLHLVCTAAGTPAVLHSELPCPLVRHGCTPVRDPPACCHHKYNCMFDADHNLIPMP